MTAVMLMVKKITDEPAFVEGVNFSKKDDRHTSPEIHHGNRQPGSG
jgi:hypothetical protein